MLFKNLQQIYLKTNSIFTKFIYKKIFTIFLFLMLSSCCADEDDFGQNISSSLVINATDESKTLDKEFNLSDLSDLNPIKISVSGLLEKKNSSFTDFEDTVEIYHLNKNENLKVHKGLTYNFSVNQNLQDETKKDEVFLGYISNIKQKDDIIPQDSGIKTQHSWNDINLIEVKCNKNNDNELYYCNISIKDNSYIFQKLELKGNLTDCEISEKKITSNNIIFNIDVNEEKKQSIQINNCNKEIKKPNLDIKLLKIHKIPIEYSGLVKFENEAEPTLFFSESLQTTLKNVSYLESSQSCTDDDNIQRCPYFTKGEKLEIFLENNKDYQNLKIGLEHRPNITCENNINYKKVEIPNSECSRQVNNFLYDDYEIEEDEECYVCKFNTDCDEKLKKLLEEDGKCADIIIGKGCLDHPKQPNYCEDSRYYTTYTDLKKDDDKTEIIDLLKNNIYNKCTKEPSADYIISKYHKCYLAEDREDTDSILRFYDSNNPSGNDRYSKSFEIKKTGKLHFLFIKKGQPYPYSINESSNQIDIETRYNGDIIFDGEGLEIYLTQDEKICQLPPDNIEIINGQVIDNEGGIGISRKTIEGCVNSFPEEYFKIKFRIEDNTNYDGKYNINIFHEPKPIFAQTAKDLTEDILEFFDKKCTTDTESSTYDSSCKPGLVQKIYNSLISDNNYKNIVRIIFSLFFIFFAISYFFGLTEFKAKELVGIITKATFIFVFIHPEIGFYWFNELFIDGFKNSLNLMIFEISNIFNNTISGGVVPQNISNINGLIYSSFSILDIILSWDFIWKIVFLLFSFPFGTMAFIFLVFPAWKMYLVLLLIVISTYFVAQIMISILFIFAPIFFIMLLFKSTQEMFNLWLKNLIGFSLQQIMVFITFGFFNVVIFGVMKLAFSYKACMDHEYFLDHFGSIITMIAAFINPSIFIQSISKFILFYFIVQIALKMINYIEMLSAKISDSISLGKISKQIGENASKLSDNIAKRSIGAISKVSKIARERGFEGTAFALEGVEKASNALYTNEWSIPDYADSSLFASGKKDNLQREELHDLKKEAINEVADEIKNSDEFKNEMKTLKEQDNYKSADSAVKKKMRNDLLSKKLKENKDYMREKIVDKMPKIEDDEDLKKFVKKQIDDDLIDKQIDDLSKGNNLKTFWNDFANSNKSSLASEFLEKSGRKIYDTVKYKIDDLGSDKENNLLDEINSSDKLEDTKKSKETVKNNTSNNKSNTDKTNL